jgi:hypothetical protein
MVRECSTKTVSSRIPYDLYQVALKKAESYHLNLNDYIKMLITLNAVDAVGK